MRRTIVGLAVVGLVAAVGCGAGAPPQAAMAPHPRGESAGEAKDAPPLPGGKPAAEKEAADRKVIYSASVEVVVRNVDEARGEVERLTDAHKGYIAKSDVSGTAGSRRTATWTLKIPADKFRVAIAGLTELGTVTRNSSDSQDVTEEFVDLEARLRNLKAEEEVLNKFLKESVKDVDGYLKTREQIKGVRSDIERAEGRLKYLSTMTALSTIQFTAREEAPYSPDPPPAAPTFGDRAGSTFSGSWRGLVTFFETVALVLVALLPWSPFLLLAGALVWWGWRRAGTRRRREPADGRGDGGRRATRGDDDHRRAKPVPAHPSQSPAADRHPPSGEHPHSPGG